MAESPKKKQKEISIMSKEKKEKGQGKNSKMNAKEVDDMIQAERERILFKRVVMVDDEAERLFPGDIKKQLRHAGVSEEVSHRIATLSAEPDDEIYERDIREATDASGMEKMVTAIAWFNNLTHTKEGQEQLKAFHLTC